MIIIVIIIIVACVCGHLQAVQRKKKEVRMRSGDIQLSARIPQRPKLSPLQLPVPGGCLRFVLVIRIFPASSVMFTSGASAHVQVGVRVDASAAHSAAARIQNGPHGRRLRIDRRAVVCGGSRYQQNVAIGRLLQTVLVRRVGLAIRITKRLEHVTVELGEAILDASLLRHQKLAFLVQTNLTLADALHFVGQRQNLVQFALAAVLSRHLVLAPAADVANQRQLRFRQIVLAQTFVEFVHGQIDDVVNRHRNVHSARPLLVARIGLALRARPTGASADRSIAHAATQSRTGSCS